MSGFARFCVAAVVVCVMSGLVALIEDWTGDWSVWTITAFVAGMFVIVVVLLPWTAEGEFIWRMRRQQ